MQKTLIMSPGGDVGSREAPQIDHGHRHQEDSRGVSVGGLEREPEALKMQLGVDQGGELNRSAFIAKRSHSTVAKSAAKLQTVQQMLM